jgi:hypothetical protein
MDDYIDPPFGYDNTVPDWYKEQPPTSGSVATVLPTTGSGWFGYGAGDVNPEPFTTEEYPRFEFHPFVDKVGTYSLDYHEEMHFSLIGVNWNTDYLNREGGNGVFSITIMGIEIGFEIIIRRKSFYE